MEATRRRIAKLKAEGALPDASSTGAPAGAAIALGLDDGSLESPRKAKKKLSDVRINPAISATFAKPGLLSPPTGGGLYRSPSPAAAAAAAAKPPAASIDLLGDLDESPAAPVSSGAADSEWDSFTAAPVPAASAAAVASVSQANTAGDDDWNAFNAAPPPAAAKVLMRLKKAWSNCIGHWQCVWGIGCVHVRIMQGGQWHLPWCPSCGRFDKCITFFEMLTMGCYSKHVGISITSTNLTPGACPAISSRCGCGG
jgi:hypothetical protein